MPTWLFAGILTIVYDRAKNNRMDSFEGEKTRYGKEDGLFLSTIPFTGVSTIKRAIRRSKIVSEREERG